MLVSTKIWAESALLALLLAVSAGCSDDPKDTEGNSGAGATGGATGGGAGAATGGTGGTAGGGGTGGKGGAGGSGGSAGGGNPNATADKLDLLLMVDNSLSMDQKQTLLAESIEYLLGRVTTDLGVRDIHVGVITSALGDHGSADVCFMGSTPDATYDDKAQLVPTVRATGALSSWNDSGFLVWDPGQTASPAGSADLDAFSVQVGQHILGAGAHGCGYEGVLESWYRFLVDPEPVASMTNDGTNSVRGPVNQVLLAQRAAFLRPDSALAIVMLSDENDCSVLDENGSSGWLLPYKGGPSTNSVRMPRASAICATAPNDPGCTSDSSTPLTQVEDAMNLRCFKNKQRFGIDFLYPIERYVAALSSLTIDPRSSGVPVPNPLFAGGRTPELVFLLGLVGVPWQDVSTPESWPAGAPVEVLSGSEMTALGRWAIALGDPAAAVDPTDPLMIESIDPRLPGAVHPLLGASAAIVPNTSTDPTANPINGHEQAVIESERSDLQFACIFPLAAPIACVSSSSDYCDCMSYDYVKNSPLCSYPAPDVDGTQLYRKAYPGLRELSVLKGLGDRGIAASICAKNIETNSEATVDPNYGYNPAMAALAEQLGQVLDTAP